jgi:hypothetical protein
MDARDWPYAHSGDEFTQMRELLVDSYTHSSRPLNWRLAAIENWNYASRYLEPREYFTDRVRQWRAEGGKLLSFLIR